MTAEKNPESIPSDPAPSQESLSPSSEFGAPRLAKLIRLRKAAGGVVFEVDGEPFPWHVSNEGFRTEVRRGFAPAVTLTIVAERLELEDEM